MVRRSRLVLALVLAAAPVVAQPAGSDPGFDGIHVAPPTQPQVATGTTGGAAADTSYATDWATLDGMVSRILELQRQCLIGIDAYHAAPDENGKNRALGVVKIQNASVEGMLLSSTWRDIVEKVRKTDDVNTTKDVRYLATFGSGGQLAVIDQTQEAIRAFLKEPAPPGARPISQPASGSGTNVSGASISGAGPSPSPEPKTLEELQNKIDELGRELARTDLTPEKRKELEVERTRLVGRIAELAKGPGAAPAANPSAAPSAAPDAGSAPGTPYGQDGLPAPGASPAPGAPGGTGTPAAGVMLVPNSYGVKPLVMSDAEIRAALDPLIEKQLGIENAKRTDGTQMNKYRQLIGRTKSATIKSVGKPDYDHYREWLTQSADLKKAIDEHARALYNQKAQAAGAAAAVAAPPPPPPDPTARAGGAATPAPAAGGPTAPTAAPSPQLKIAPTPDK